MEGRGRDAQSRRKDVVEEGERWRLIRGELERKKDGWRMLSCGGREGEGSEKGLTQTRKRGKEERR